MEYPEKSMLTTWAGNVFYNLLYSLLVLQWRLAYCSYNCVWHFSHSGSEHQHVSVQLHPGFKPPLTHSSPAGLETDDRVCRWCEYVCYLFIMMIQACSSVSWSHWCNSPPIQGHNSGLFLWLRLEGFWKKKKKNVLLRSDIRYTMAKTIRIILQHPENFHL